MKGGIMAGLGGVILAGGVIILGLPGDISEESAGTAAKEPTTRAAVVARACRDVPLDVEKHDIRDGSCLVMAPDAEELTGEASSVSVGSGQRMLACFDGKGWSERWDTSFDPLPKDCQVIMQDMLAPGVEMTGVDLGSTAKLCARFCPTVLFEECPIKPNSWGPVWRCAVTSGSWDVRTCAKWCEGK